MWYVAIGISAVLGAGSLIWFYLRRRTAVSHANATLTSLTDEFADGDYDRQAIRTAYEDVTKLCGHGVFRKDDLERTLGILPEDFEDVFQRRCQSLGIGDVWSAPYAEMMPVRTVEDYVRFLTFVMRERAPK